MSRKKRMFDINLPDEIEIGPVPKKALARRGPMAAAISENSEALQARKDAAQAIRDENDQLAHEYVALRAQGDVVQRVGLDQVFTQMLVRDRMTGEDEELAELVASIRDVGLSNPIRVLERPDGGYELLQGFRRLQAYRHLHSETGQGAWGQIPALIVHSDGDITDLYRRMVDENVIRKDLSFAEMAYAARNFLNDPQTEATDIREAIAALFQSAAASKRNFIRQFAQVLDEVGDGLKFPTAISRALGLSLARALKNRSDLGAAIRDKLREVDPQTEQDEVALLQGFVDRQPAEAGETAAPIGKIDAPQKRQGRPRTKTTFHMQSRAGQVKCTAGPGRLEIKVDQDFSSIDRARLEEAVASLIEGLGE